MQNHMFTLHILRAYSTYELTFEFFWGQTLTFEFRI